MVTHDITYVVTNVVGLFTLPVPLLTFSLGNELDQFNSVLGSFSGGHGWHD